MMGKRQARGMLKGSLSVCPLAETKLQKKLLLNQKGDKDRNQHQHFSQEHPGAFLLCMVSSLIQCLSDFVIIIPYLCPESLYDSVIPDALEGLWGGKKCSSGAPVGNSLTESGAGTAHEERH